MRRHSTNGQRAAGSRMAGAVKRREFVLPWPPAALSPNARSHWRDLARAKASYRRWCWLAVLEAMNQQKLRPAALGANQRLQVQLTFHPPDRREYDKDNLIARMKAGLDGVSDAIEIDDKKWGWPDGAMGNVVKGGAVVIALQVADAEPAPG